MKRAIALLAFLMFWGGAWADLVAAHQGNELRLMPSPCVHGGILGLLKPEHRPLFKKGQATVGEKTYYACWLDTGGASTSSSSNLAKELLTQ